MNDRYAVGESAVCKAIAEMDGYYMDDPAEMRSVAPDAS